MTWVNPITWTFKQVPTFTQLNAEIRDHLNLLKTSITDAGKPMQLAQSFRGLHLRTSPNPDTPATVLLAALDDVVMDSFTRYAGLTLPLTADPSVSGAGGLDTGTLAANRWYDIFLIGKSGSALASDLRLLLHLSDRTAGDNPQTTTGTAELLRQGAADRVKLAQGIKVTATGTLPFVDVTLQRTGTVTSASGFNMFYFTLETDAAGSPSGTVLATSDKLLVNSVSTSAQAVRMIFRAPVSLTAGTQYHLVLQADYDLGVTNYLSWVGASSNAYPNGSAKKFNGTTWAAATPVDFTFTIHPLATSAVTYPTGYDEKCRLGYVYIDGSANPQRFIQRERVITPIGAWPALSTFTQTAPLAITDLSTVVPPVPVIVRFGLGNASGSGAVVTVAPVPDGFAAGTATFGIGGGKAVWVWGPGSTGYPASLATIDVETQGAYLLTSSSTAQAFIDSFEFF